MSPQISIADLSIIQVNGGNVHHGLKASDSGFNGFGEAYLTWINSGHIKAWKRHTSMWLNLIVPVGIVKFVFYIEGAEIFQTEIIGEERYSRITVPPMVWFGFKGLSTDKSLVLNIANIEHAPDEQESSPIYNFSYNWD